MQRKTSQTQPQDQRSYQGGGNRRHDNQNKWANEGMGFKRQSEFERFHNADYGANNYQGGGNYYQGGGGGRGGGGGHRGSRGGYRGGGNRY